MGRHRPCPLEGLNSDQSTHIKGLGKSLCSPVTPGVRWRWDPVPAGLVRLFDKAGQLMPSWLWEYSAQRNMTELDQDQLL